MMADASASPSTAAMQNIVLIGFMGSGKSSVATALADLLGLPVAELDALIVEAAGGLPIPQIFEQYGEPHFRALEEQAAATLATRDGIIISAGGGVIEYPRTINSLAAPNTAVVYLKTALETILSRLGTESHSRPLFKAAAVAERYRSRLPLYERYATLTVATDGLTVSEVAAEVARRLREGVS